jgi:hypothetical protein
MMYLRKRRSVISKVAAVLFAVVFLFGTPASHAATHSCPTSHSASASNDDGDAPSTHKMAQDGRACCTAVCATCLLVVPAPAKAAVGAKTTPIRFGELHDHLFGQVPLPGLEPPRPAA